MSAGPGIAHRAESSCSGSASAVVGPTRAGFWAIQGTTRVSLLSATGVQASPSRAPGVPVGSFLRLIELLGSNRHGLRVTIAHVGFRRAVDQQAEQFRAIVVAARIHQLPLSVDRAEIEIGDQHPFTRTQ